MKKALVRISIPQSAPRRFSLRAPLVSALILLGLIAGLGIFASRPAHTVAGPVAVAVSNTVSSKDIDNAARQPFATRVYPSASSAATFAVPAGKRLVIQEVTAFSYDSTTVEDVAIFTNVSGVGAGMLIPFTVTNRGVSFATQAVTDYADPGSTVTVYIDDANISDSAGMNVDIKGYYVNIP